ncbi:MAG: hypothetical protein R3F49_20650 [Planctomycetota bacterium]
MQADPAELHLVVRDINALLAALMSLVQGGSDKHEHGAPKDEDITNDVDSKFGARTLEVAE